MSVPNLGTPPVPEASANEAEHRRRLAKTINQVIQGKINATIDVTLAASTTTTTVNDPRIFYTSAVIPAMALTAHAALDLAAGIYVTTLLKGSCVLNHRNDAATDRTLRLLIIG